MSVETTFPWRFHAIDATLSPFWARRQSKPYLYPLCTATTPKVMSRTVGDLKPAMASCESSSN